MIEIKGVDVSNHNGKIDWETLSKEIDFAIIRAGYSHTTDVSFNRNISEANKYNVKVGIYWFSYALSSTEAKEEAKACLAAIQKYKVDLPVYFDFEYDSENYAKKIAVFYTGEDIRKITRAFCETIKEGGYTAGVYTNVDYINRAYKPMLNEYPIWLAQWGDRKSYSCAMWQYTSAGRVKGIQGYVDRDILYLEEAEKTEKGVSNLLQNVIDKYAAKYIEIANDILSGKYGNGEERKRNLKAKGYDASFAQAIVNAMLGIK